jgi:hypothetical protein
MLNPEIPVRTVFVKTANDAVKAPLAEQREHDICIVLEAC